MRVFRLRTVKLWMTKKGIEESQVHLQVRKSKATLIANEFRDLYEWFEGEESQLVRKSLAWEKKRAPIFALGEFCAISGQSLMWTHFGRKETYVKVVSLRPLRS